LPECLELADKVQTRRPIVIASQILRWDEMRSNSLDMLKVALQRVELTPDTSRDPEATAELKNVLVDNIAKLELVRAIEISDTSMPTDTEIVCLLLSDDEELED
jgi:hypothetical protein